MSFASTCFLTPRWSRSLGLALLTLTTGLAQAQVYRSVDAQGRVTFSDTPPAFDAQPQAVQPTTPTTSNLPAVLRQPVQRFPVTLYSATDCAPCDSGRAQLQARGVPFVEKTVQTPTDIAAFHQLGGGDTLPTLRIGQQLSAGHADTEWARLLDAAGYPQQSALPADWRSAPVTPLAPTPAAAETAADAASDPADRTAPPIIPSATPDNPAGLSF